MHRHPIIRLSLVAAFLALASSVVLAAAYQPAEPASDVVATPPTVESSLPAQENEETADPAPTSTSPLSLPMADAHARVTKKTFGLAVSPETSPVPNDRFTGYHVGVDFEVSEEEQGVDVPVWAVCDGPLLRKGFARGYGGYALQACEIDGEPATIVYGHLDEKSITHAISNTLVRGETVGLLGEGHSPETDGVRKHLHLGIHRGTDIDIRGYVRTADEINAWLDPLALMP